MATKTKSTSKPKTEPKPKAPTKPKAETKKAEPAAAPTAPKPPRIPPFINGDPFPEVARVALTGAEFEGKTMLMLELQREKESLVAESDASKAEFKARIKEKDKQIADVLGIMSARSEEQSVAVYWRFHPKRRIKQKHNAGTHKAMGQAVPMTPDEVKKHMQPDLLDVPATPKPVPTPAPAAPVIPPPKEGESLPAADEDDDELPSGHEEFKPQD